MTDAFETYVKTIQLEAFPTDVTKEKPDTLSFRLASYVAAVRHFSSIKALNRRGQGLSLHVGVTTELSGNAFATSDKGRSYIGITFGHFLACSYPFNRGFLPHARHFRNRRDATGSRSINS